MVRRPLIALLVLLAASSPALAQYKWKDAQGQVHASDLPPPREVPDKDILQRPQAVLRRNAASASAPTATSPAATAASGVAVAGAAASKPPADPELEARRKKAEQEAQARRLADDARAEAQRADNCQRARQQVASLDSGQRLVRINERGERVPMDDATRDAELAVARRAMASDCR